MTDVSPLSTISFQPEAFDGAADAWRRLVGWTVKVRLRESFAAVLDPPEGTMEFDAIVSGIDVDPDTGQYVVDLKPDLDGQERGENWTRTLDIYDDIERVEVY